MADRHDILHQAVDLSQGTGLIEVGVPNAERHAADAVVVVLLVQGQILPVLQGVQQGRDAALGNAQLLGQLGQGVTNAVLAAQLQDIQGPGQGTVGVSGRHRRITSFPYYKRAGPGPEVRASSGARKNDFCSDMGM